MCHSQVLEGWKAFFERVGCEWAYRVRVHVPGRTSLSSGYTAPRAGNHVVNQQLLWMSHFILEYLTDTEEIQGLGMRQVEYCRPTTRTSPCKHTTQAAMVSPYSRLVIWDCSPSIRLILLNKGMPCHAMPGLQKRGCMWSQCSWNMLTFQEVMKGPWKLQPSICSSCSS